MSIAKLTSEVPGRKRLTSKEYDDLVQDVRNVSGGSGHAVFGSVSEMRLYQGNAVTSDTTSYYAGFHSGGTSYYVDSTDTTSADDGMTVFVDGNSRRWKRSSPYVIDLESIGCKMDGLFDNSSIINNIVNKAKGTDLSEGVSFTLFDSGNGKLKIASKVVVDTPIKIDIKSDIHSYVSGTSAIIIGSDTNIKQSNEEDYDLKFGTIRSMNGNSASPATIDPNNHGVEVRCLKFSNVAINTIIAFTGNGLYLNSTNDKFVGQHIQDNNFDIGKIAYCGIGFCANSIDAALGACQVNQFNINNVFANFKNFKIDTASTDNTNNNIFNINGCDLPAVSTNESLELHGNYNKYTFGFIEGIVKFYSNSFNNVIDVHNSITSGLSISDDGVDNYQNIAGDAHAFLKIKDSGDIYIPKKTTLFDTPITIYNPNIIGEPQSDMNRYNLKGTGAATSCLRYTGTGYGLALISSAGIGAHSHELFSGFSYAAPSTSYGIHVKNKAYAKFEDITIQGVTSGMFLESVLSSEFYSMDVSNNVNGIVVSKGGGFSLNNANTFYSPRFRMNSGVAFSGGAITNLKFYGGNVEGNGTHGNLGTGGINVTVDGSEGGVGLVLDGVYFEGNAGGWDINIENTGTEWVTHIISGCNFNRVSSTNHVINNIRATGKNKIILIGNSFSEFGDYVASASRLYIDTDNITQVYNYGNTFESVVSLSDFMAKDGVLSVKDFGAIGDGVTDDTAAFQNAISSTSSSQIIIVPFGDYKLTTDISCTNRKFIFYGATTTKRLTGAIITNIDASSGSTQYGVGEAYQYGSYYKFGRNAGGPIGLAIGGGDSKDGGDGNVLFPDNYAGWTTITPNKYMSSSELAIQPSSLAGRGDTVSGTNRFNWVSGGKFDVSLVNMIVYIHDLIYVVDTVDAVNQFITVKNLNSSVVTFTSSIRSTFIFAAVLGSGICNTNGTSVTRILGDPFVPATNTRYLLIVNGVSTPVNTISGTDLLTTATSLGLLSNVSYKFITSVDNLSSAIRVHRIAGAGAEENLTIGAYSNGYYHIHAGSGTGTDYPLHMGVGYVNGKKSNSITIEANKNVKLGNNYAFPSLQVYESASQVSGLSVYSNINVSLRADSTGANADLELLPKGNGRVTFGSATMTSDTAITGFIEIKDSIGNIRKLALIN